MKKALLTLFLLLICSNAHATVWFACTSGGNWSANVWTSVMADQSTCATALGTPIAGDTATLNSSSGNITITSAAAAAIIDETGYAGTLAFGVQILTTTGADKIGGAMTATTGNISSSGGVQLLSTPTGSFPSLNLTATQTIISGGFTWPGKVQVSGTSTMTLSGNWINSGLLTNSGTVTLTPTSAETWTANGGLTNNGSLLGTVKLILGGTGTYAGSSLLAVNVDINCTSLTISGTTAYSTGTFNYISGTVTATGTANFGNGSTLNSGNIIWNNFTISSGTTTVNLISNLNVNGIFIASGGAYTLTGAFNITVGTLNQQSTGTTTSLTIPSGQTLNVTSAINMNSVAATNTLKSGTASSPMYLNYTGPISKENINGVIFTDVSASAPPVPFFGPDLLVLNSGLLTRTTGISNYTAANVFHRPINPNTGV